MTSAIDPTKPTTGNATTASVRTNFQSAKDEIEALQAVSPGTTRLLWVIRNADLTIATLQPLIAQPDTPAIWRAATIIRKWRSGTPTGTYAGRIDATDTTGSDSSSANLNAGNAAAGSPYRFDAATALSNGKAHVGIPYITNTTPNGGTCLVDILIYGYDLTH